MKLNSYIPKIKRKKKKKKPSFHANKQRFNTVESVVYLWTFKFETEPKEKGVHPLNRLQKQDKKLHSCYWRMSTMFLSNDLASEEKFTVRGRLVWGNLLRFMGMLSKFRTFPCLVANHPRESKCLPTKSHFCRNVEFL